MTSLCLRSNTESFATVTCVSKKMIYCPQTGDLSFVPELFVKCDGSSLTEVADAKGRMVLYRKVVEYRVCA